MHLFNTCIGNLLYSVLLDPAMEPGSPAPQADLNVWATTEALHNEIDWAGGGWNSPFLQSFHSTEIIGSHNFARLNQMYLPWEL